MATLSRSSSNSLVDDSWICTTVGVEVLSDPVLEVVDRDGLCVLERIARRHEEVRLAYRKQLVLDALRLAEKLHLHGIQDECQVQLPALGLYLVTGAGPLVSPFIPGQVEPQSRIGVRQTGDRDCSEAGQDLIEHLLVEAVSRTSVRQHRDGEV